MNEKQALAIKQYCEGAYPNMKKDDSTDLVWIDMLQSYDFNGIMQSVKKHIYSGNKFAPSLAELIKGYELILNENNERLVEMVANELDVQDQKHIDSIRNIIYHPNVDNILRNANPNDKEDWLLNTINKCKGKLINVLFGGNIKRIG